MTGQKCTGTQTIANWLIVSNSCVYQVTLLIDGVAITNAVPLNSGMSNAQIAILLNANRINNTTGTISVTTSGSDLLITITDIELSSGASGAYTITASGTGAPCPDFSFTQTFLTCTIMQVKAGGGGGGKLYVPPAIVCFRRQRTIQGELVPCAQTRTHYGLVYTLISSDSEKCCYKKQ